MTTTATATITTCTRCGRPLRSAKSLADKMGRACKAKVAAAGLASTDQPAQVAKAVQLIADGGVVRVAGSLFLAVSTDGTTRYEVDAVTGQCACPAGQHGRRCYHLVSVELVGSKPVARPTAIREPVTLAVADDPFVAFDTAA